MRISGLMTLAVLGFAAPAAAAGDKLAAPSGPLGAGLSLSPEQKGRAYVDFGFAHTTVSESILGAEYEQAATSLTWIFGGGFRLTPTLELEAMLPLAWIHVGQTVRAPGRPEASQSDSALAVGNLHLGLNYLHTGARWRLKVGGAVEYGPWTADPSAKSFTALAFGHPAAGGEFIGLWAPEVLSLVAPGHVEFGDRFVGGGDFSAGLHIPTDDGDVELTLEVAPGAGYYVSQTVLLGARLPFTFVPTSNGSDQTLLAFEPYARFDFERAFLSAGLMLNLDDPYGFAFDDGKVWAIRIGAGATF